MTIKNFSWNYVGWLDLEDVGFEGTPIDSRQHTNDFLATVYGSVEKMATTMDRLGYDALYTTEHHFQREGIECIPNLQILFTHLAHLTKNLRFGCAFNILPQWHPLRLAEDYAMADILTRGRVIFGVGRGSQTRELETLGAPMLDQEKNRDLFEEQVEVLVKAFHDESFSHHGKTYNIPPAVPYRGYVMREVTVVPRPIYNREIWQPMASGNPRGMEFQAKHGIKGILGFVDLESEIDPKISGYREFAHKYGRNLELGEDLGLYLYCHLGDSVAQAASEVEPFQEEAFKRAAGIGGGIADGNINSKLKLAHPDLIALGDPLTARTAAKRMGYTPLAERAERDRSLLFGTAEEVIATLKLVEERYPALETIILHPPELTHTPIMLKQMQRFAEEVMPAFPAAIKQNRSWPDHLADPTRLQRYVSSGAGAGADADAASWTGGEWEDSAFGPQN